MKIYYKYPTNRRILNNIHVIFTKFKYPLYPEFQSSKNSNYQLDLIK